jgi:uncharacterized protein (DUF1499 family)
MSIVKWLLVAAVLLVLLALLAGQLGLFKGSAPPDLGLREGKLKPPSRTPNSVSSQADLWPGHPQRDYARVAPLACGGDAGAAMARLRAVVEGLPGARVVEARDGYLYATFTTRLMKYTDDAEFVLDRAAGVIHVRSASRLGRKDFGVNRARVETIRARLAAG